mgnify:FL=1
MYLPKLYIYQKPIVIIIGCINMDIGNNHSAIKYKKEHYINAQVHSNYSNNEDNNNLIARIKKSIYLYEKFDLESINDSAKLMNRIDTKYLLTSSDLPKLLNVLRDHYKVLEIDNNSIFTYKNRYLDTEDFEFFRKHHNGKQNRYKVRYRHYVDSGTEFLEVKFKNNKRRTIKNRIEISNKKHDLNIQEEFLTGQLSAELENLQICQHSEYKRVSLVSVDGKERLTLDFDLKYKSPFCDKNAVNLENLCIAELKQPGKSHFSVFENLMRRLSIQPTSFSKYCIGCCSLYPDHLKQNRFKPVLNIIKKLTE